MSNQKTSSNAAAATMAGTTYPWAGLPELGDEPCLSPEGEKLRTALNGQIRAVLARRDKLDARLAALKTDPAEFDPAKLTDREDRERELLAALQAEYKVRHAIEADYRPLARAARERHAEAAAAAVEKAEREVRQGLVGIGYVDGVDPATGRIGIGADFIMVHPAVRAARAATAEADDRVHCGDLDVNRAALDELAGELKGLIAAAV